MTYRKATLSDLDRISSIYDEIHTAEEAGRTTIGWVRGIYPTRETAKAAILAGDMYVAEDESEVIASARINREQVPEYALADWFADASPDEVLVLHTLTVAPQRSDRGVGSGFVGFYEETARRLGCPHLRMDTNERNLAARRLYRKLGYREAGTVPCTFNGIPGVRLVCLEKELFIAE